MSDEGALSLLQRRRHSARSRPRQTDLEKRSLCNEGTGLLRSETGKGNPRAARQGGRSEDKLQQSGTEPCRVNALTTGLGEADGEGLEIGGWGCGRGRGKRRVGGTQGEDEDEKDDTDKAHKV